jgi:hypothetical protein
LEDLMKKLVLTAFALTALVPFAGCKVEKVEDGRAPSVAVDPGELPEYDVDAPDVEVRQRAAEVRVPDVDVDVKSRDAEITVPDIDIKYEDDDATP